MDVQGNQFCVSATLEQFSEHIGKCEPPNTCLFVSSFVTVRWPHTSSRGLQDWVRVPACVRGNVVDENLAPICE